MIRGYEDLEVYRESYHLVLKMYEITRNYPAEEKYNMISQIRRSSMSIVLNIVEGYGRKDSAKEFQHFLRNAIGSSNETRVLIKMSRDLGYIEEVEYRKLEEEYETLSKKVYRLKESWR